MKYTLTFLEEDFEKISSAFKNQDGHERAAYLFCNISATALEKRLLVTEVEIVQPRDILDSSSTHISVLSRSFVKAMAKADNEKKSLIFVHSHPGGFDKFSAQDNREEKDFFKTAYIRAPEGTHGSMILVGDTPLPVGRIWENEEQFVYMDRIRVVGKRLLLFDYDSKNQKVSLPAWADRQVRAFGKDNQKLLSKLHIGVIGAGGTGSSVVEQLIRLGVKRLTVIDDDTLEDTNVARLYGSHMSDVGKSKVDVVSEHADSIGLGTEVATIKGNVCDQDNAKSLRDCDLVFCCTDDANGRMVLNRLAVWYLIPMIDMAVAIDSQNGQIKDITGRVTLLLPNKACLLCRGRVAQQQISAESLRRSSPDEYKRQVKEGYAPELGDRDPSVIMFTTSIASRAVMMFMHMITGYLGKEWTASEIIERYHDSDIGKNSSKGSEDHFCMDSSKWGKGDENAFLGRIW